MEPFHCFGPFHDFPPIDRPTDTGLAKIVGVGNRVARVLWFGPASFDHRFGPQQDGGGRIDNKIEFGGLFDRKGGELFSAPRRILLGY